MFSINKKLDKALKCAMDNDRFKNYRVIIHCNALLDSVEHKIKATRGDFICKIEDINCICAMVSSRQILRLIETPEITFITFDDFAHLCSNNIPSPCKTNSDFINSSKYTGNGVGIGIIDSGVYPHPDLLAPSKRIVKFIDIVNKLKYPYDDNGQGTVISGLITGSGSSSKGVHRGLAPKSNIYCIKAFNAIGKAYISDVFYAISTLIRERDEFNIKVICLPFEIYTEEDFIISMFKKLFEKAISANIVVIAASGSNGNIKSSIRGFASLSSCITVGGLDTTAKIKPYSFSSSGPCGKLTKPDFSVPCVNIYSLSSDINYISERNGVKLYPTKPSNYYTTSTGTSCAAAYVSGVCSLLFEKDPNLHYKDILSLLSASCNLLDFPKWQQGEGLLDLNKLLS
jgi:subtilisin family serine protease